LEPARSQFAPRHADRPISLLVGDHDAAIAFYVGALGLDLISDNKQAAVARRRSGAHGAAAAFQDLCGARRDLIAPKG